ncbi:Transcriptional regulator KdgR [Streptomyces sp. YIM 130001]|uniref:IclR family transcriptional regulator n=1 Tax=Streptomyces sp. YIM 130001 TaxID=2259644 RepID=UPI000EDB33DC|nr:IclR family transcriptional regulator [Streptomyces sp. YIM 130001]RII15872.1 Transcriptional regulator KdgR [Streptomyces sp. YIM 130001]
MSERASSPAYRVPAVVQAFDLLDTLAEHRRGLRLSDLVERLGLSKSTTHRLLRTLQDLGAVTKDGNDGRYVLGSRLALYAQASGHPHTGLIAPFYSVAERIRDRHDETIQLAVLSGAEVTFVAYVETTQAVRLFTRVGRRLPAHASASGKAILAFRDEAALTPVLDAGLAELTDRTITDEKRLRAELSTIRTRGWGSEVEESARHLSCFSVPVLDRAGSAVAAVTACVPTAEVPGEHAEQLVGDLRSGAEELGRYL